MRSRWARDRALADPRATSASRSRISNPAGRKCARWPTRSSALRCNGRDTKADARPYNSLARHAASSEVPLVAARSTSSRSLHAPLPVARAAALLRSPYLAAAADDWLARARLERDWLREGRAEFRSRRACRTSRTVARARVHRWRAGLRGRGRRVARVCATPRAWTETWRDGSRAAGWPGERGAVVRRVAGTGARGTSCSRSSPRWARGARRTCAAAKRVRSARKRLPRGESVPAGVRAGADSRSSACSRPRACRSTRCGSRGLPPRAGRRRRARIRCCRSPGSANATCRGRRPRASLPMREALTGQWARGAPEVVFSLRRDRRRSRPTDDLVAGRRRRRGFADSPGRARRPARNSIGAPRSTTASRTIAVAPHRRRGDRRGGAGLSRGAKRLPVPGDGALSARRRALARTPLDGFSPMERGTLVHAALAAFWREVGDHAGLLTLVAGRSRRATIDAAVATAAMSTLADGALAPACRPRWRAGEARGSRGSVARGSTNSSAPRPPFAVTRPKHAATARAGRTRCRAAHRSHRHPCRRRARDRRLQDGDRRQAPAKWFDDRAAGAAARTLLAGAAGVRPRRARPRRRVCAAETGRDQSSVASRRDAAAWPGLRAPGDLRT